MLERSNSKTVRNPPLLSFRDRGGGFAVYMKKECPQNHRKERFESKGKAFSVYKAKFHSRGPIGYGIFLRYATFDCTCRKRNSKRCISFGQKGTLLLLYRLDRCLFPRSTNHFRCNGLGGILMINKQPSSSSFVYTLASIANAGVPKQSDAAIFASKSFL